MRERAVRWRVAPRWPAAACLGLAMIVGILPATVVAMPEEDTGDRAPAAEALFREGRRAFEAGDFETARRHFAESHRLEPAPGTLLNLALSEEKLGELARAWQHAQEVVDQLPPGDERAAIARALVDDLQARVPRLTVILADGAPDGTRVLRGGVELRGSSLGTSLPVDPGQHTVVVTAPGRPSRAVTIDILEGENEVVTVSPSDPLPDAPRRAASTPAPAAPTGDLAPRDSSLGATLGIVAIVTGGASLGASLVFTGLVLDRSGEVDAHCDAERRCDDVAFDAAEEGRLFSGIATGTFIGGAALSAIGVGLVVFWPDAGAAVSLSPGPASVFASATF